MLIVRDSRVRRRYYWLLEPFSSAVAASELAEIGEICLVVGGIYRLRQPLALHTLAANNNEKTPMLSKVVCASLLLMLAASAKAELRALDNAELASVSGTGIALALGDFMYEMKPTSYAEQIGSTPSGTAFKRGDLRWYGTN